LNWRRKRRRRMRRKIRKPLELTNEKTASSRVIQKLIFASMEKKLLASHTAQSFITIFTKA
jgi:hypothetical protein